MTELLTAPFFAVLEVTLAVSLALLLLLPAMGWLRDRYGPVLRTGLWTALALWLCIPLHLRLDSAIRLLLAPRGAQEASADALTIYLLPQREISTGVQAAQEASGLGWGASPELLARVIPLLWLLGGLLFLAYHLTAYLYGRRQLRRWGMAAQQEETALLESLCRELGVCRRVELLRSPRVHSPYLAGFFQPRIALPARQFAQGELEDILRHELCHLRRGDLWKKLLYLLSCAVHWFNPLVHWMARQADFDLECACDRRVLAGRDGDARRRYGRTILSLVNRRGFAGMPLTTCFASSPGSRRMKRRFADIAGGGAPRKGVVPTCTVLAVALTAGLLVSCGPPVTAETGPESAALSRVESLSGGEAAPAATAPEAGVPAPAESEAGLAGQFLWPAPGYYTISSPYGELGPEVFHGGIDIVGSGDEGFYGAEVVAAAKGRVAIASMDYSPGDGYGIHVLLDHGNGLATFYSQLSDILVEAGDTVEKGQAIARVGSTGFSTGPHLHFEVRENGEPRDPIPYLSGQDTQVVEMGESFLWPAEGGEVTATTWLGGQPFYDILLPEGTPIYAAAAGTVTISRETWTGYGHYLVVDHDNGFQTVYGHASELLVEAGESVTQGQLIARVGRTGNATGNKLRFELRYDGEFVDPRPYLGMSSADAPDPAA